MELVRLSLTFQNIGISSYKIKGYKECFRQRLLYMVDEKIHTSKAMTNFGP